MKKYVSLVLFLCLSATFLEACSANNDTSSQEIDYPKEFASSLPFPVDAGYFDRDFDYTMYRKFEVVYLIGYRIKTYLFFDFDRAFGAWAERMNIEYKGMHMISENSKQAPISLVQTYIDLGIDGIFFDGADDVFKTVVDMCTEAGVAIWRCMEPSRDINTAYI
ncbi:MAG: hypothetical protein FWH57_11195 [Oscillospiraceae bacterium]|nr:hypothetical protein [Oscillospiraceae bacterium]